VRRALAAWRATRSRSGARRPVGGAFRVAVLLCGTGLLGAAALVAGGCASAPTGSTPPASGGGPAGAPAPSSPTVKSASPTAKPSAGVSSHAASRTPAAVTPSATAPPSHATSRKRAAGSSLRITFVDVGQGDAIVVRVGDWTGLIDGGPPGAADAVAAALRADGAQRLDCLVITHPHADHIGGLPSIITQFRPRLAAYASTATTATWRRVYGRLKKVGARLRQVRAGATLAFGKLKAQVLSPSAISGEPNDDSVVVLLEDAGKRFLFTGDLHGPNEDTVGSACARGPPIYLLKVAHHGSASSTGATFLSELRPQFAVISVGANSYGHPSPQTLARLRAAGTRVYSTQNNGSITVTETTAGDVTWSFSRSSRPLNLKGATAGSAGAAGTRSSTATSAPRASPGDPIVYITKTGECYHRAGCRYLAHSKIAVRLSVAEARGYQPCSVCDPPH
jgi:competence protein ComEC